MTIRFNRSSLHAGNTSGVAFTWYRSNGLRLLALCFILVVSVWRWQLLWSSLVALVLGVVLHSLPNSDLHALPFPSTVLLEYWMAGLVWVVCAALLMTNLTKSIGGGFLNIRGESGKSGKRGGSSRGLRASLWVVSGFILIGVEAPLLAPFNPSSQGDLRTTRLAVPFTKGFVPDNGESTVPGSDHAREKGIAAEMYDRAYHTLMEHSDNTGTLTEGTGATPARRSTTFFLGTDNLGRDVLSRLLYGIRISLIIGSCAMALSLLLGSLIGFASGFSRSRFIDEVLMRMVDLFLAVPSLFLIVAVVAFFGNSTMLLVFVLAGTGWMNVARMVRGEVLHIRGKEFILAAGMLGRSNVRIVIDHVIPNILPTVIVAAVLQLGNVILAEASLSFLGLGIQPPTPSLGNMIGESLAYIGRGWWVGVFPGLALTLIVVSVNSLAENLQDRLGAGGEHPGGLP